MAVYDIDFGEKLAETARIVLNIGADTQEAVRVTTYLSLLSAEISLKAMLEKAGVDPSVIRQRSHRLRELLADLCGCEIEIQIAPEVTRYVSAARLCSDEVPYENAKAQVGRVLQAEREGASSYPNEVRYGEAFKHFPPAVLVGVADAIAVFARKHWHTLRVKNGG